MDVGIGVLHDSTIMDIVISVLHDSILNGYCNCSYMIQSWIDIVIGVLHDSILNRYCNWCPTWFNLE